MTTMILSGKRQVVLPAGLCQQMALVPGSHVQVELAPDGSGILVRPAMPDKKKPASRLFGRFTHHGKPVPVEELQGAAAAQKLVHEGKLKP